MMGLSAQEITLLINVVLVVFYFGKTSEQLKSILVRLEKFEKIMEGGGFAHCQLHTERIARLEHQIELLRDSLE